jgi:hypothetical protein
MDDMKIEYLIESARGKYALAEPDPENFRFVPTGKTIDVRAAIPYGVTRHFKIWKAYDWGMRFNGEPDKETGKACFDNLLTELEKLAGQHDIDAILLGDISHLADKLGWIFSVDAQLMLYQNKLD